MLYHHHPHQPASTAYSANLAPQYQQLQPSAHLVVPPPPQQRYLAGQRQDVAVPTTAAVTTVGPPPSSAYTTTAMAHDQTYHHHHQHAHLQHPMVTGVVATPQRVAAATAAVLFGRGRDTAPTDDYYATRNNAHYYQYPAATDNGPQPLLLQQPNPNRPTTIIAPQAGVAPTASSSSPTSSLSFCDWDRALRRASAAAYHSPANYPYTKVLIGPTEAVIAAHADALRYGVGGGGGDATSGGNGRGASSSSSRTNNHYGGGLGSYRGQYEFVNRAGSLLRPPAREPAVRGASDNTAVRGDAPRYPSQSPPSAMPHQQPEGPAGAHIIITNATPTATTSHADPNRALSTATNVHYRTTTTTMGVAANSAATAGGVNHRAPVAAGAPFAGNADTTVGVPLAEFVRSPAKQQQYQQYQRQQEEVAQLATAAPTPVRGGGADGNYGGHLNTSTSAAITPADGLSPSQHHRDEGGRGRRRGQGGGGGDGGTSPGGGGKRRVYTVGVSPTKTRPNADNGTSLFTDVPSATPTPRDWAAAPTTAAATPSTYYPNTGMAVAATPSAEIRMVPPQPVAFKVPPPSVRGGIVGGNHATNSVVDGSHGAGGGNRMALLSPAAALNNATTSASYAYQHPSVTSTQRALHDSFESAPPPVAPTTTAGLGGGGHSVSPRRRVSDYNHANAAVTSTIHNDLPSPAPTTATTTASSATIVLDIVLQGEAYAIPIHLNDDPSEVMARFERMRRARVVERRGPNAVVEELTERQVKRLSMTIAQACEDQDQQQRL